MTGCAGQPPSIVTRCWRFWWGLAGSIPTPRRCKGEAVWQSGCLFSETTVNTAGHNHAWANESIKTLGPGPRVGFRNVWICYALMNLGVAGVQWVRAPPLSRTNVCTRSRGAPGSTGDDPGRTGVDALH